MRLSLLVATTGTLASLLPGIGIAYLLARGRFWGKAVLDMAGPPVSRSAEDVR